MEIIGCQDNGALEALAHCLNSRGDICWRKNIFYSTYYPLPFAWFHMSSITFSSLCEWHPQYVHNLRVCVCVLQ